MVGWSVKVTSPKPTIQKIVPLDSENIVTTDIKRTIYDPVESSEIQASIFDREKLNPGDCIIGPAIIFESQTTTWISSSSKATVQNDACLLILKTDTDKT